VISNRYDYQLRAFNGTDLGIIQHLWGNVLCDWNEGDVYRSSCKVDSHSYGVMTVYVLD
jgi:hypothetical protein